jgi:hypothetical protein
MQLSAAQTSLEPQPRRVDQPDRRPFVSQNINQDDGSRFASEPDPVQRPRVAAHGLPNQSQTSCRLCAVIVAISRDDPAQYARLGVRAF